MLKFDSHRYEEKYKSAHKSHFSAKINIVFQSLISVDKTRSIFI
jgi:hypothetical protein